MMNKGHLTTVSWILVVLYAIVTLARGFVANMLPVPLMMALITFLPILFFFVHGSFSYRVRDLLVFAAVTLVVSNIFEDMSILTGFPFGRYFYTDILGPKLFLVPVLIGPAYIATGYLSWAVARLVSGATDTRLPGQSVIVVPLLASFMMASWDLTFDPIASTLFHGWIWVDGGSYFGVPFSNFMGWLLTAFVFFQLFALYLKRIRHPRSTHEQTPRILELHAILFYGLTAARYLASGLSADVNARVADPAGVVWRVQDIYSVTGLIALFTMGVFVILGVVRLMETSPAAQAAPPESAHTSIMPAAREARSENTRIMTGLDGFRQ